MRHLLPIVLLALVAAAFALSLCTGSAAAPASPTAPPASPPIAAASADQPQDEPHREVAQPSAARDAAATADSSLHGRVLLDGRPLAGCTLAVIERYGWQGERVLRTVTSDERGAFAVDGLPAGNLGVLVRGDDVPHELPPWTVQLSPAQRFDLGELRIPAAVTLRGRVVDAGGKPVAGVTVFRARTKGGRFRRDLAAGHPDADPQVVTDGAGIFEFAHLAPVPVQLLVDEPGWAEVEETVELSAGQRTQVPDITLRHGRQLRGQVRDQGGAPIAGATITPASISREPNPRRAVTADVDGTFTIDGMHYVSTLSVAAAGFARLDVDNIDWSEPPAPFVLSRLTGLRGRVTGLGSTSAHVVVEPELDDRRRMPPMSAYEWLHKPLPVQPDGSFAIDGLPDASYLVTAFAPAVGESVSMKVGLPCGPVELAIVPGVRVPVTVRDDTGRPLPSAEVFLDLTIREYPDLFRSTDPRLVRDRIDRKPDNVATTTDDSGLATIVAMRGQPLAVGARCPDHVQAMVMFFDSVPATIELVLSRAGRIVGRVDDLSGLANHGMCVAAWPQASDPRHEQRGLPIDAGGAFHSGALLPGPWLVAIQRHDMSHADPIRRPHQPVPLLGGALFSGAMDERTQTLVVVPPAGEVEVALRSRPLTRIDGRVLANGVPVGDIVVFGVSRTQPEIDFDEGFNPAGLDAPDAHEFKPHAKTAADGTFTMHVAATGVYELRARHPRQAVANPPTLVTVTTLGERVAVELSLPAGGLRGRGPAANGSGNVLSAYLYPAAAVASDPFCHGDLSESDANDRLRIRLDGDGAFAFEFVPPGTYLLRLTTGRDFDHQIAWQTAVTVGSTSVDLGELPVPPRVTASVILFAPADTWLGAWIRQELPGLPEAAFLRTLMATGGRLELASLAPGRYRVQFFTPVVCLGQMGLMGAPRGDPIAIELRADGTTEPRALTPP